MSAPGRGFFARVLALTIAVQLGAHLLTAVVSPRVLLLDRAAAASVFTSLGVVAALTSVTSALMLLLVTRGTAAAVDALFAERAKVAPEDVLRLHAVPVRFVVTCGVIWLGMGFSMLLPGIRARGLDGAQRLALLLLLSCLLSTALLPTYVALRASVARVLELAPTSATHEALVAIRGRTQGRIRRRFALAVLTPVTFIALGASLLVDANTRTYDRDARVADAIDVTRAVLEPVGAEPPSDAEVRAVAAAAKPFGYAIGPGPDGAGLTVARGDEGITHVTVPLGHRSAAVSFAMANISPVVSYYLMASLLAIGLATLLGYRIGVAFDRDLALATREVQRVGVADVVRGTFVRNEARFAKVDELLEAIDSLGGVFREFASAQQRAIDARGATERMRALLLASMSHDLKAPLNAILGFAELVGRNDLTEGQRESLTIVTQRGRELLLLIDTILDSARAEAGELEVVPTSSNVDDIVMSAVLEARDLSAGTPVQVQAQLQPDIPPIFVDGTRIAQALTAIVMTAARFAGQGIVEVRGTLPEPLGSLRIEIETNGEGLPRSEREKIFDTVKDAASARRHGSLGLGLQLARAIVEIHEGRVEVEHATRGGLVFRVWLPVQADPISIRKRAAVPSRRDGGPVQG